MQGGCVTRRGKVWIVIIVGVVLLGAVGLRLLGDLYFKWMSGPGFWATDIAAFAAADRDHPPPERPIVFVGSSSIRLWSTLQTDMAPLPVLNRGFGGSQLSQVVYYVDQTVTHYRPRAVVLYAGDNDLDGRFRTGKTPADVAREFRAFVARVEAAVPDACMMAPAGQERPLPASMGCGNAAVRGGLRGAQRLKSAASAMREVQPIARVRANDRQYVVSPAALSGR
jgi:hypothetical protein